jgi:predicted lysophospholipase L1 biosynthesis ABC-type transport system permease subunit
MEMPILVQLQTLQYFGMFIGVMLKAIIASLFLLSVLMLDSTLQAGLDKQKTDMAILKVIGANRLHVAGHVLGGAVRQVLMANLIAYPLAYLTFNSIETTAIELIGHKIELIFTLEACASAAFIGLLVPIIASLTPIKGLIDSGLTDSFGQGKLNYS